MCKTQKTRRIKTGPRYTKKAALLLCMIVWAGSVAAAQTADEDAAETGKGKGITATLELKIDAFNLKNSVFGHAELRGQYLQNNTVSQFFVTTTDNASNASNSWSDSELSLGYEGEYFGGNYALKAADFTKSPYTLLGKVRGWVQFGFLRVTVGNDIETSYADALDADPGLRLYTGGDASDDTNQYDWQASINPDNITQDEGIMVEARLDPFNIALAAGEFKSVFDPSARITNGTNNDNEYIIDYLSEYRLGARVGYEIGDIGKVNLAYILKQKRNPSKYTTFNGEIVPTQYDAQVYEHQFGAYGSLHLTPQIDLTIGYNGDLTAYIDEIPNSSGDLIEIGYPIIFKNGLNINARAKILPQLTLRTDHSASFWQDKNYDIFKTNQSGWNKNGVSKVDADQFAAIDHFVIWNGIGADYNFTDKLTGTLYLRNLFGRYSVSGKAPKEPTLESPNQWAYHEYVFTRDQVHLKMGLAYNFTSFAKAYMEIIVEDTITIRSRDLNSQTKEYFVDKIHGKKPDPVKTTDNELVVRIPIGITLQLR